MFDLSSLNVLIVSEEWRPGSKMDNQAEISSIPQLHYILYVKAMLARIGKP